MTSHTITVTRFPCKLLSLVRLCMYSELTGNRSLCQQASMSSAMERQPARSSSVKLIHGDRFCFNIQIKKKKNRTY